MATALGGESSGQGASMGLIDLIDHLANVQIVGASSSKHLGCLEGRQDLCHTSHMSIVTSSLDVTLKACRRALRYSQT